jgi:FkbM family methyltransferase
VRFLFIVRQKKNVDTFQDVISILLDAGHHVTLAIQEPLDQGRRDSVAARFPQRPLSTGTASGRSSLSTGTPSRRSSLSTGTPSRRSSFEIVACPEGRGDEWRASAPLVRSARDWAQYLRAPYRHASKLRARAAHRLGKELGADDLLEVRGDLDVLQGVRVRQTLERIEAAIPSDRLHEEFLRRHAPDVVLVTPGLHFGSAQTDFIKSAGALGIPVWMLLFSWDNLSTKGALHSRPDLMFVWNELQRKEAVELHDYPAQRVVVVGAPRFDEFFTLRSVVSRNQFLAPLGLDPSSPTLLYVCSSRFIAERELPFIQRWLAAVRGSTSAALRGCNVIVRPHPDVTLVDDAAETVAVTWSAMPQATGWVQQPFGDPKAVVLRTTYRTQQAFFECLHHSAAVVGLNTSAELEAGIAGRPVFTLLVHDPGADGQSNTLHFNYLLRDQGGFVVCAPDLPAHVAQLGDALESPSDPSSIRTFIDGFLRPNGPGPVSELLAQRLVEIATRATAPIAPPSRGVDGEASLPPSREASADHRAGPPQRTGEPALLDVGSPRDPTSGGGQAGPAVNTTPRVNEATLTSDDDAGVPEEARKKVRLGYPGSTVRVIATPETRPTRRKGVLELDKTIVDWLDEHVHPGDVAYDIGAGVGAYSLVVAMHRGALSVAFEPGFASFKRLVDNLLLNGCYRSVIPLPLALGDRNGLLELEYRGEAGGHGHSLRPREWRTRRDAIEAQYTQPVCAERLDDVVERHRLPRPRVMRVAMRRGAAAMIRGAGAVLRDPQLRSVLASVKGDEEAREVVSALEAYGFTASITEGEGGNRTVVLVRPSAQAGLSRAVGLLRRVTGRRRAELR